MCLKGVTLPLQALSCKKGNSKSVIGLDGRIGDGVQREGIGLRWTSGSRSLKLRLWAKQHGGWCPATMDTHWVQHSWSLWGLLATAYHTDLGKAPHLQHPACTSRFWESPCITYPETTTNIHFTQKDKSTHTQTNETKSCHYSWSFL